MAVTLAAGVVIAGGSAGTNNTTKPYTAVFGNSVAGGATSADVTLTIKNLSANQSLGSANVTAASNGSGALTINGETGANVDPAQTYPTSLLMLRNLGIAPGGSRTVHISVKTPCASGSYTWGIGAKQSNDFNGPPGNAFTLQTSGSSLATAISGSCKLKFVTQPASAAINSVITDSAYSPTVTGGPSSPHYVSVQAVDGSGAPIASATGTVTLSKVAGSGGSFAAADTTASFNLTTGIATFSSLKSSAEGSDLQLEASASGFADSDPSSPAFSVTPGGANCLGVVICSFTTPLTNTQVDTTGTGDFNFIGIGNATVPASVTATGGGCEHFIGTGTGFNETDSRNGSGTLDFTYYIKITALKKAYGPNYGQPNVPLCAGGKVVVNNHPVDCDPATQTPWHGRHLGTDGTFDGTYRAAVCGAGGYWWAILGTKQDPNPPINPAFDPTITGWGGSADGLSRTFAIHVPAGWDWRMT